MEKVRSPWSDAEEDVRPQPLPEAHPHEAVVGYHRDVTVLTVDDHRVFREALCDMIAAAPGFVLIGQACMGEEAVRAVEWLSPQLVMMDVAMPGMGGIAATRAILNLRPELLVVLISVDHPSRHPGVNTLGNAVTCVRKQDLGPKRLRELWETRGGWELRITCCE